MPAPWRATSATSTSLGPYESTRQPVGVRSGCPTRVTGDSSGPISIRSTRPAVRGGCRTGTRGLEGPPPPSRVLQRRAARASPAGRPKRSSTCVRRSLWEPARGLAKQETDFDLIREDPGFRRWWASKTPFAAEEDPALACARGLVVGTSRRAGANDGRDRGTAELGRSP
jgi:hypothetical protein